MHLVKLTNKKIKLSILHSHPAIHLLFILYLFISCNQKKRDNSPLLKTDTVSNTVNKLNYQAIDSAGKKLQDGQLVTRSDNDFESMIMQNFSRRERVYSHSGIVFKEAGGYVVYHCMGGEENPGGACQRDPFDSFVNPLKKTGFGIFQYRLSVNETEKLHTILKKDYDLKIPFDASFNLKTDDSLYCSEMICKALKQATGDKLILPSSFIENFKPKIMGYKNNRLFFKKFEFIGIDDLYLNPFCKEITRVKYK
jgi:hypothetical protein